MFEAYPNCRMRRNRKSPSMREMVAETDLSPRNLILPIFVHEGETEEVQSMPGIKRFSIKDAVLEAKRAESLGISAIDVFPSTPLDKKTSDGSEALNPDNLVCRFLNEVKGQTSKLNLITDVALDPYTSHGHDGILNENGAVDNDATCEALAQQSVLFAKLGADVIAPSDMMDGRIAWIRESLDNENMEDVSILSYSAKYNSKLYGPFRDAVGSKKSLGKADKATYQMDIRNRKEAIREAALDINEGADMIMVKPGLFYLDIVRDLAENFHLPIMVYHVSGEYSMIKLAAQNGILDEKAIFLEATTACRRAGASGIFTYYAKELAEILTN